MIHIYLIISSFFCKLRSIPLYLVKLVSLILIVALPGRAQEVFITSSNDLACAQLSATLSATTTCSGTGTVTYSFRGPNSFSLVNTTGVASVTASNTAGACIASNTVLVGSSLHPDYLPLVDFFNSTGGPNWIDKTGWLTNCDPCNGWFGITCTDGRVTRLSLVTDSGIIGSNNLNGNLPSSIGKLNKLRSLRLNNNNNLTGTIPESFSQLTDLQELHIFYSGLSGTIMDKLVNLTQLETIILTYSKFTGPIPESISALTKLKVIAYPSNGVFGFTGSLPASLSALTGLEYLALDGNRLTGTIPPGLGQLTNLISINLSGNLLAGPIPSELGNLVNLSSLYLSYNQLSGSLPASLGNLPSLNQLLLRKNFLSGCIPLSFNSLCGKDVQLEENLDLPAWSEFCFNGTNNLASNKAGSWFDPTVWSCGKVPTLKDYVTIRHNVSLPAIQSGQSRKIIYKSGGGLNYDSGSKLRIGQ
ncbi:hypothetical protein IC229_02510 [Spirosoma sp. BT702]|uniref:Leucine-rich repeat-containing N-terminal plant-type domain-containing protein n=1 Tax=Spirosoma profusum TaxID=2771354 RepID=A0A927AQ17_9BACT|nr:hypothetical protein [Spirosoma profusum]MBD2699493.1 hypothetical protein [Spirosoma profusum]